MLRSSRWLAISVVLAACSGSASAVDAGSPADSGALTDANEALDATGLDATGLDAAAFDGSVVEHDAGPRPDAGCLDMFAACAHPPAGFTLCGGGAVDPTAARTACDVLDPPRDIFTGVMKACDALSIGSGHYDVYCGPSAIYVWVSLDGLTSTDVLTCSVAFPLPDGGVVTGAFYRSPWALMDTNNMIYAHIGTGGGMLGRVGAPYASSDRTDDPTRWDGSLAVDGTLAVTAGTTSGTGALYLTSGQQDCDGIPTGDGARVVLAVPISWGS